MFAFLVWYNFAWKGKERKGSCSVHLLILNFNNFTFYEFKKLKNRIRLVQYLEEVEGRHSPLFSGPVPNGFHFSWGEENHWTYRLNNSEPGATGIMRVSLSLLTKFTTGIIDYNILMRSLSTPLTIVYPVLTKKTWEETALNVGLL